MGISADRENSRLEVEKFISEIRDNRDEIDKMDNIDKKYIEEILRNKIARWKGTNRKAIRIGEI